MPMRVLKWKRSQNYMKDFLRKSFSPLLKIRIASGSLSLAVKTILENLNYQIHAAAKYSPGYIFRQDMNGRHQLQRGIFSLTRDHHSLGFGKERQAF